MCDVAEDRDVADCVCLCDTLNVIEGHLCLHIVRRDGWVCVCVCVCAHVCVSVTVLLYRLVVRSVFVSVSCTHCCGVGNVSVSDEVSVPVYVSVYVSVPVSVCVCVTSGIRVFIRIVRGIRFMRYPFVVCNKSSHFPSLPSLISHFRLSS